MKYIITENRIKQIAINYLNEMYGDLERRTTEDWPGMIFFVKGKKIISVSCDAKLRESTIAEDLSNIQNRYLDIDIGSYPYSQEGGFGTVLVMRSTDETKIQKCKDEIEQMIKKFTSKNIF